MADSSLPAWVYKRDGRLVPFDADRISQALFAAGETLGQCDPFLARELTDGILHFLAQDHAGEIPTTSQIAELVATIARELGQAALAQAFITGSQKGLKLADAGIASSDARPEGPRPQQRVTFSFSPTDEPAAVRDACLREYALHAVYGRDLVAAHRDGLLTLTGLETPGELAGCVFDPAGRGAVSTARPDSPSGRSGVLVQALLQARNQAGSFLAIDGPEHSLSPFASARDLAKNSGELLAGLEATGLVVIINLNSTRPSWAEEQADGPLFAEARRSPAAHLDEYRAVLLEQLLRPTWAGRVRFDWHLAEHDFADAGGQPRLGRLARAALESASLNFVFDRPDRPVSLAEGVDRKSAGVLLAVGIHLSRLLQMPGVNNSRESFLQKAASLVRMAVSAGVQKRNYLRRHDRGREHLAREFLLDRARLVVVPVGLDGAVHALAGEGIASGRAGLETAEEILASLLANLRQAGRDANLDVCLDGVCGAHVQSFGGFCLPGASGQPESVPSRSNVSGVTAWDSAIAPEEQIRAAGHLHARTGSGTAAILFPAQAAPSAEDIVDLLSFAWKRTQASRLHLVRLPARQENLDWRSER